MVDLADVIRCAMYYNVISMVLITIEMCRCKFKTLNHNVYVHLYNIVYRIFDPSLNAVTPCMGNVINMY